MANARRTGRAAALAAAALVLTGCGGHANDASGQSGSSSSATPTTSPSALSGPTPSSSTASGKPHGGTPAITKVLVFVVENHSLDQMRADMPKTYALAQQYAYATDYQAVTHPSLPNYLTMASGDTGGVTDDNPPSDHPLQGPSIFERALQAGRTAGLYADAMPTPCDTSSSGTYAVKHNPWAYFPSERADCQKYDVPVSGLDSAVSSGSLPDVGMVVPDLCNDAHDCPLSTADSWIAGKVAMVMSGPDWRSGHLAIVITADEDDSSSVPDPNNRVLTVVVAPDQQHHVVTAALTHKSLYGLFEDVAGVPHTEPSSVGSMAQAFGLKIGH